MRKTYDFLAIYKKPKPASEYPEGAMGSLCVALLITLFLGLPAKASNLYQYFWIGYCIANLIYVIYNVKRGTMNLDISLPAIIMFGPIAFFFWTVYGAYSKYWLMRRDSHKKKS